MNKSIWLKAYTQHDGKYVNKIPSLYIFYVYFWCIGCHYRPQSRDSCESQIHAEWADMSHLSRHAHTDYDN